jgi:hypothetical protein
MVEEEFFILCGCKRIFHSAVLKDACPDCEKARVRR